MNKLAKILLSPNSLDKTFVDIQPAVFCRGRFYFQGYANTKTFSETFSDFKKSLFSKKKLKIKEKIQIRPIKVVNQIFQVTNFKLWN